MDATAFASARLKVDRAVSLINELQSVLASFLKTDFYRLWLDADAEPGAYIVKYDTQPLPPEIPLIIGDTIHNLHVALDHITSQIARDLGRDSEWVHFPKDETRHRVAESSRLALIVEAAPSLKEVILDQICPYKGGRYALWEIGKLDNIDKHKLLVPTLGINRLARVSAMDEDGNQISGVTLNVAAGNKIDLAEFSAPAKITDYGKPAFNIAFAKSSYFDGQPVIPTLIQLSQYVREVIVILERAYFGSKAA